MGYQQGLPERRRHGDRGGARLRRGTHSLLVPTVLDHPDCAARDLSSFQTVLSGAAAVPASLVRRTTAQLGCRFSILFGQTETHGVISQTRVTDAPDDQATTVGQPLPQLEVKIADPENSEPVPVGERGEICCRGYQNMVGYYGMPDDTAATIDADGWLHMGDVGTMDERGYLTVTGRVRDMTIRGGMNLYPAEIEAALTDHPAIESAAVIGVPDERWGEQVAAVLRLRSGPARPSVEELTVSCATGSRPTRPRCSGRSATSSRSRRPGRSRSSCCERSS
jgi:fatty-acyl-CoA synthase